VDATQRSGTGSIRRGVLAGRGIAQLSRKSLTSAGRTRTRRPTLRAGSLPLPMSRSMCDTLAPRASATWRRVIRCGARSLGIVFRPSAARK